jgi:hypothetical protein
MILLLKKSTSWIGMYVSVQYQIKKMRGSLSGEGVGAELAVGAAAATLV